MSIPKIFISYSHDSQEHKQWVLKLATRLRKNDGIDVALDTWDLKPGDDLPLFMEKNLQKSDYTLMICSDNYVAKANNGTGGVGYEKMILTSSLLQNIDNNKIIPIIKQNGTHNVPTFIKTKLFIDLSFDNSFEFNYDELIRTLHQSPLYVKPEIGNNPFETIEDDDIEQSSDSLRELMKIIILEFENGEDYHYYKKIVQKMNISRIMLDMIFKEAIDKNLIEYDDFMGEPLYILKDAGKAYAIQHKLIKT